MSFFPPASKRLEREERLETLRVSALPKVCYLKIVTIFRFIFVYFNNLIKKSWMEFQVAAPSAAGFWLVLCVCLLGPKNNKKKFGGGTSSKEL